MNRLVADVVIGFVLGASTSALAGVWRFADVPYAEKRGVIWGFGEGFVQGYLTYEQYGAARLTSYAQSMLHCQPFPTNLDRIIGFLETDNSRLPDQTAEAITGALVVCGGG